MTNNTKRASSDLARDDRILPTTKVALIIVVPFLALAFLILYFFPERTGDRFAWAIKPAMTALFISAGYLGGGYQFVRLIFGRKWHRYGMAFPPVMTFTVAMLAATLLHWDRGPTGGQIQSRPSRAIRCCREVRISPSARSASSRCSRR